MNVKSGLEDSPAPQNIFAYARIGLVAGILPDYVYLKSQMESLRIRGIDIPLREQFDDVSLFP